MTPSWLRKVTLTSLVVATMLVAGCASRAPVQTKHPVHRTPEPQRQTQARASTRPSPPSVRESAEKIKKSAPFRYIVEKGDTLWGIATKFLRDPWDWPYIWYENPYIKDPHLIFPGDVITLANLHGQEVMSIYRGGTLVATTSKALSYKMLRPKIQRTSLAQAIPSIPYQDIAPLILKFRVMRSKAYYRTPYVLHIVGRLIAASPDIVYARGISPKQDKSGATFALVRKVKVLYNPRSHQRLGYEVAYLGRAVVTHAGDPSTLRVTRSVQEIKPGDRLVTVQGGIIPDKIPLLKPRGKIHGQVISVIGGDYRVGQYQSVILDQGSSQGVRIGDVLTTYRHGRWVNDPYAHGKLSDQVRLPRQATGQIIVYRVYPQVSYALVMHAHRSVMIGNTVGNP